MAAGLPDHVWSIRKNRAYGKLKLHDPKSSVLRYNPCLVLRMGASSFEISRTVLSNNVMGKDSKCEAIKTRKVCRIHGSVFRQRVFD